MTINQETPPSAEPIKTPAMQISPPFKAFLQREKEMGRLIRLFSAFLNVVNADYRPDQAFFTMARHPEDGNEYPRIELINPRDQKGTTHIIRGFNAELKEMLMNHSEDREIYKRYLISLRKLWIIFTRIQ